MSFETEPNQGRPRGSEMGGGQGGVNLSQPADSIHALSGDMGGGANTGPPPPWADPESFMQSATPTPEAAAERAQLMSHWADDAMEPALDVHGLIGDLEANLNIDPSDKRKSLTLLNQAAAAKKDEAHQQVTANEAKLDKHEADGKEQVQQQVSGQLKQVQQGQHAPTDAEAHEARGHSGSGLAEQGLGKKPADQVCGLITKDSLRTRVQETMAHELAELDADYTKEQQQLETKVGQKLDGLDAEKQKQEGKIGDRSGKGQEALQNDIAKRAGQHADAIAKEQKTIDADAAPQNLGIGDQGANDKARAATEQQNQVALTQAHAQQRAADVRAKATGESSRALTTASGRGMEMADAATARAAKVPSGERGAVNNEGTQRNTIALFEGQKRQQDILAQGERDAKTLRDEGQKAQDTMAHGGKAGAPSYSDQIAANTKAGIDRVDGAAKQANADMKAVSNQAVTNMEAADGESKKKSDEQAGTARGTMDSAENDAKATADKEKTAAQAKMKESYESTKAKIQAKAQEELAKIEKSKDADLCKLDKQVSGDLKSMQQMAEHADAQMAGQVKLAERKVAAEVAKKKAVMQQTAQKAIIAINGFLAQARQKIKAADKNTLKDIQATGKLGQKSVSDTGTQALDEVTKKNEAVVQKIATDGASDRATLDAHEKASEAAMAKTADQTKDAIDDQVINETLAVTGKTIQKKSWHDWTSDKQANTAMDALTSLPKDLQGKAVEKLPADQFKNLISEVPKDRREEFEPLVQATTDPDRKLQLWAGYAKSKAHNDADRMEGDTGHWYGRSAEQKTNDRKNDIRQNAADTTDKEVDEEVGHLRALQKSGTPLTKEAVNDLYDRKKLENDIEMKYSVNITNDVDGGKIDDHDSAPTQRRVWSKPELEQLNSVVGRLPEAHRDQLKTIRRSGIDQDWNKDTKKWQNGGAAAYMTPQGEMRYFDSGANGHMRHTGEPDFAGNPITSIEENFPHELGHSVENSLREKGKGEIVDRFYKAAGWETLSEADLRARMGTLGLDATKTNAQVTSLNNQRPNGIPQHYLNRTPFTGPDGKLYEVDPYSGNFLAVNQNAMPDRFSGGTGAQNSHWGYARSNQRDHFAETYMMAVHTPKALHQDLVGEPTKQRDQAKTQLDAANDAVKAASTDEEKRLAQDAVKNAQAGLDRANATVAARGQEWSIMRNEINGTNKVDQGAKAELSSIATNPAKLQQRNDVMKQYEEEAAQSATPEQINLLKAKYQAQLEALK